MKKHPELLNRTTEISKSCRCNILGNKHKLKSIKSVVNTTPEIKNVRGSGPPHKKITMPKSRQATPPKIKLDGKIDPKKPILLDISIKDPKTKGSHTTKAQAKSNKNRDSSGVSVEFIIPNL